MKISKQFFNILWMIPILLASLLSACSAEDIPNQSLASVSVKVGLGSKALASSVQEPSLSYKYNVTGSSESDSESGKTWKTLEITEGQGTIENLFPGSCTISISAWSGDTMLYSGSSSVVLVSGEENEIIIQLVSVESSTCGSLVINITGKCDSLYAVYRNIGKGSSESLALITSSASADGTRSFNSTTSLPCGSYEVSFTMFKNGVQCGGEVVACQIPACGSVVVSGTLESGLDSVSGVDITTVTSLNIKQGTSQSFVYKSNGVPVSCCWTLNGNVVSETTVYNASNLPAGSYTVRCTVGSVSYSCNINSYVHETISLTRDDVLAIAGKGSKIYSDITLAKDGQSILNKNSSVYPLVLTYTTFDEPTSLEQIGVVGTEVAFSNINSCKTLIIGMNAPLSSSSSTGWLGQSLTEGSNSILTAIYCFKDLSDYAFYRCTKLSYVWLGDSVSSVGKYALGRTIVRTKTSVARYSSATVFDDLAFSR